MSPSNVEGAVAEIYNAGIAERVATFETDPRSAPDLAGWASDRQPFVVATQVHRGDLSSTDLLTGYRAILDLRTADHPGGPGGSTQRGEQSHARDR